MSAPIFSADGRFVYFLKRETAYSAKWEPYQTALFTYRAHIIRDHVNLARVEIASGQVERLKQIQTPLQATRVRASSMDHDLFSDESASIEWVSNNRLRYRMTFFRYQAAGAQGYHQLVGEWSPAEAPARLANDQWGNAEKGVFSSPDPVAYQGELAVIAARGTKRSSALVLYDYRIPAARVIVSFPAEKFRALTDLTLLHFAVTTAGRPGLDEECSCSAPAMVARRLTAEQQRRLSAAGALTPLVKLSDDTLPPSAVGILRQAVLQPGKRIEDQAGHVSLLWKRGILAIGGVLYVEYEGDRFEVLSARICTLAARRRC